MENKICSRCQAEKPATSEFFYKSKGKKDGFQSWCKSCAQAHDRKRAETCRQRSKAWRLANPERRTEVRKAYEAKNRETIKQKRQKYYLAKRKDFVEKAAQWQKLNPEKSKAIRKAYDHRRRGWKSNSVGQFTWADILHQLQLQENKCYWCGVGLRENYHVDHIIPLSKGGSNGAENIACTCPDCNLSKGNKLPAEWVKWKASYD